MSIVLLGFLICLLNWGGAYFLGVFLEASEANLTGVPDAWRCAAFFFAFFLLLRSMIFILRSRSPRRSFPDLRSNLTPIPFWSTRTIQPFSLSSFLSRVAGKIRFIICPIVKFSRVIIKAPPRLIFLIRPLCLEFREVKYTTLR